MLTKLLLTGASELGDMDWVAQGPWSRVVNRSKEVAELLCSPQPDKVGSLILKQWFSWWS